MQPFPSEVGRKGVADQATVRFSRESQRTLFVANICSTDADRGLDLSHARAFTLANASRDLPI